MSSLILLTLNLIKKKKKLTYLFDKINPNPSFEGKEEEDMRHMKRLRKEVVDGGSVLLYLARSRTYNHVDYHITIQYRTTKHP